MKAVTAAIAKPKDAKEAKKSAQKAPAKKKTEDKKEKKKTATIDESQNSELAIEQLDDVLQHLNDSPVPLDVSGPEGAPGDQYTTQDYE